MKKIVALLLALMMVASLSITAFAADEPEVGSITINSVSEGTVYEIYKLLTLESYDLATGAYSYKADPAWATFFATNDAKAYFTTDAAGYVTWTWVAVPEVDERSEEQAIADFAKLALAYAKDAAHPIAPTKSNQNEGEFVNGKFSNLDLGYYLVDSSVGALCGLTTTNPNASINAKNGIPTLDKQVKEDSTSQWGDVNTADIGQDVEYRVTITVHAGAENYVLHDTMEDGLTYKEVTKIEHVVPGATTETTTTTDVPAEWYTVKSTGITDGCDFEVAFAKEFCDHVKANDKIVVYYHAMLNRNAEIYEPATDTEPEQTNDNTAWLTFGETGKSQKDTVQTKTYRAQIVKTDSQNKLIDGAKFKVFDAATGGNEVKFVILQAESVDIGEKTEWLTDSQGNFLMHDVDGDGTEEKITKVLSYRRARADETGAEVLVCNGLVPILGLDNGTYYLQETEAPDGYNKITARQSFIINDANLDAIFNGDIFSTGSGVHVVNKTGTVLPETGAAGTMMFITFGMFVVLGTGILLVTKKRMSMIMD